MYALRLEEQPDSFFCSPCSKEHIEDIPLDNILAIYDENVRSN